MNLIGLIVQDRFLNQPKKNISDSIFFLLFETTTIMAR
jgi:hypothetical protein